MQIMRKTVLFGLYLCINYIKCHNTTNFEGFVVHGSNAEISNFPHSAALSAYCGKKNAWICGSSIVNQRVLLTAAHCVIGCDANIKLSILFGTADRTAGKHLTVSSYIVHHDYDEHSNYADIALIMASKPLRFTNIVSRVAIVKKPPYNEVGKIAGWGLVDEDQKISTHQLKHTTQNIMNRFDCGRYLGKLPEGVICGGGWKQENYVAMGDSGSGLLVRDYIQVGVVSFKMPAISRSLVIYTDVGYFYKWILASSIRLLCAS